MVTVLLRIEYGIKVVICWVFNNWNYWSHLEMYRYSEYEPYDFTQDLNPEDDMRTAIIITAIFVTMEILALIQGLWGWAIAIPLFGLALGLGELISMWITGHTLSTNIREKLKDKKPLAYAFIGMIVIFGIWLIFHFFGLA